MSWTSGLLSMRDQGAGGNGDPARGAPTDAAAASDGELLRRIGHGDALAIAAIYDRYSALLLGVALRVVRDRADAEDVVHDVFGLVGDRADRYLAERGSVSAWLVTLTRNLSIDRKRRRDRRGAIHTGILVHEPQPDREETANPEMQAVAAAEWVRVRRALDTLPPPQRATLELAFFAGLSYPEIAELENLPLGTVKSRASRALIALRDALTMGGGRRDA
jgi:RNA polymerase sigma-70 factor (ECF subfamily)